MSFVVISVSVGFSSVQDICANISTLCVTQWTECPKWSTQDVTESWFSVVVAAEINNRKQWQQKPWVKQFWRRKGLFVCTPSSQGRQRRYLKLCPHLIYSQKQRERKVCPLSLEPKLRPWFHHQWKDLFFFFCTSIHVIRTVLQRQPRRASWSRQPLTEIFFPGGSVLCQVDT